MRAQLTTTIVLVGTMLVAGQAAAQFRYRYAQLPPYPSQTMPYLPQTLEGGTTSTVAPGFDPYAPGAGAAAPAPAVTLPGATAVPPTITLPGVDPLAPTTTCPPTGCPPLQPVLVDLGPRWRVFGEFLYLRAGDAAMTTYAVPVNGPILPPPPPSLPVGPYATIDPDREPGFRAGVGWFTSKISEWSGTYTWLESQTTDSVSVAAPAVLQSLVVHPATAAATTNFLNATANSNVDLQMIDLEYRRLCADGWYRAAWVLGGRYAMLDQDFLARFTNPGAITNAMTHIDFDGAGIRVGLEGEWFSQRNGFLVYGKGFASFLAGEFTSSFRQTDNLIVVLNTSRKDERIVPILDLELGVGWRGPGDRWRFSAGYLFSSWFNVVSNEEFIRAVHTGQITGIDDTLTFDGLVGRAELRF